MDTMLALITRQGTSVLTMSTHPGDKSTLCSKHVLEDRCGLIQTEAVEQDAEGVTL